MGFMGFMGFMGLMGFMGFMGFRVEGSIVRSFVVFVLTYVCMSVLRVLRSRLVAQRCVPPSVASAICYG